MLRLALFLSTPGLAMAQTLAAPAGSADARLRALYAAEWEWRQPDPCSKNG